MGGIDFGESALIDLQQIKLDWFDYWLKGIDNGIMAEPPVDIFVMGKNQWKKADAWPLRNSSHTKLYLRSAGKANTMYGDGRLSSEYPAVKNPLILLSMIRAIHALTSLTAPSLPRKGPSISDRLKDAMTSLSTLPIRWNKTWKSLGP